uniref:Uncharacterized protein n=1 Tax=Anguilla anguilla TaxID=7936 RepID=A0A0E9TCN9_ANGAN
MHVITALYPGIIMAPKSTRNINSNAQRSYHYR